ncbi:MAG TPA: substrate-binding domain-containing protein [Spirochaetia bacterium]|nr:substrate-binding domain-containing protein [Spirochaetia bacterium]
MLKGKWSKGLVILLALCVVASAAFGQDVQNKKFNDPSRANQTYYMCTFVMGVEYWVAAFEGFKDCAKQLGVKAVYTGTGEYKLPEQVTAFEQIFAKNPAGIALSPIDDAGFVESVKLAQEKKIPVVTFASNTSTPKPAFVTSDNVKEGQAAARAIGNALGGKGKVMVTRNTQSNHQIRVNTFVETIKKEFPGITVVADVLTQQDNQKAYTAVMQTAQKYPDLGAVFSPEGPSGRGAAQAAVELGGGTPKIKVMCCDMDATILQLLEEHKMFGSIQPNAYVQGYMCMLMLYLIKNEMLDPLNGALATNGWDMNLPVLDNGLDIITPETAKYFYTDKWQTRRGSTNFKPWP